MSTVCLTIILNNNSLLRFSSRMYRYRYLFEPPHCVSVWTSPPSHRWPGPIDPRSGRGIAYSIIRLIRKVYINEFVLLYFFWKRSLLACPSSNDFAKLQFGEWRQSASKFLVQHLKFFPPLNLSMLMMKSHKA